MEFSTSLLLIIVWQAPLSGPAMIAPQPFPCRRFRLVAAFIAALASIHSVPAQPAPAFPNALTSVRHEVERAIERGLDWLQTNQSPKGWWSSPEQPAITALALSAFMGAPGERFRVLPPPFVKRGYACLLDCVQPDGGIHRSNLVTYNTSIAMMALVAAGQPEYDSPLRKAREFLAGLQRDFNQKGVSDSEFDGGVGYGTKYEHSDMGNTLAALEALHHTRHLVGDKPSANARDLNWAAAIQFLQNCQNLATHNTQRWVSEDPRHRGGFIYYPGHSMAGSETNAATGLVALRSYGSISYAGLLSYIYARLDRNDPRVTAVLGWVQRHYTLDENPGLGPQGFYYYLHTMTKALTAAGVDELELAGGGKVPWRRDVALKLINLQQRDGSWSNENGRWWEKDPALVTAYAVLSLETIARGL